MITAIDTVLRKVLRMLSAINEWTGITARNSAGMLLIAMMAIVLIQIVFRYVLNDSLIWTEEVSKTLMVMVFGILFWKRVRFYRTPMATV